AFGCYVLSWTRRSVCALAHVGVAIGGIIPHAGIERKGLVAADDAVAEAIDGRRLVRSDLRPKEGGRWRAAARRRHGRRNVGAAAARDLDRAFRPFVRLILALRNGPFIFWTGPLFCSLETLHNDGRAAVIDHDA